jgi:hypothetical protein
LAVALLGKIQSRCDGVGSEVNGHWSQAVDRSSV